MACCWPCTARGWLRGCLSKCRRAFCVCLLGRCSQVWAVDSYWGDDVLVGQAELPLAAMLAAENPHPLAASLTLQAIDDDTGQVRARG